MEKRRLIFFIVLSFFWMSCHTKKAIPKPEFRTFMLYYDHLYSQKERYYYSSSPEETWMIKDSNGRALTFYDSELNPDSCFKYWSLRGHKFLRVLPGNLAITVSETDEIVFDAACRKVYDLFTEDSSFKGAWFWYRYDTAKSSTIIFRDRNIETFPYRVRNTTDSMIIHNDSVCTQKDMEAEAREYYEYRRSIVLININPNPFKESFHLKVTSRLPHKVLGGNVFHLKFIDETGQVLLERDVLLDEDYELTLPDLPAGKRAFYTLSLNDLVLNGSVMKIQ